MNSSSHNSTCVSNQATAPSPQYVLFLPVAAKTSARTRFAPLQPSTARAMHPHEALMRLEDCMQQGRIDGIEITGPGDPLAAIDASLATLRLISERYPDLPLSLATLGIGCEQYAGELHMAGVNNMKIIVDAVDAGYLEKIYSWIRPGTKTLSLPEAARILIDEQWRAVPACKNAGMTVSIVTTVYPGVNTDHLEAIASSMAACGADSMILSPYRQEDGADIALPVADAAVMAEAERICQQYLPVVIDDMGRSASVPLKISESTLPQPTKQRPNVAVASSSGLDIDLHLGQARQLLIYGPREDGLICLLEARPAPEPGGTGKRWRILATRLTDCFAVLAASAGETPRSELAQEGITVLITEDTIEGKVDVLYGGGKKGKQCRK